MWECIEGRIHVDILITNLLEYLHRFSASVNQCAHCFCLRDLSLNDVLFTPFRESQFFVFGAREDVYHAITCKHNPFASVVATEVQVYVAKVPNP